MPFSFTYISFNIVSHIHSIYPSYFLRFFQFLHIFWTFFRMYTSHSRRMPVLLMPLPETAPEISSHKPHTEVFFPLHHHAKFPDQTEVLQLYHAKPPDHTSTSSQQECAAAFKFLVQSFPPSIIASASFRPYKSQWLLVLMIQLWITKSNDSGEK